MARALPFSRSQRPKFKVGQGDAAPLTAVLTRIPERSAYLTVMACLVCDNTGWVCEEHPDRPWRGTSQRADACDCVRVGMPCECNP